MGKFQFPKVNLELAQERFKENLDGSKGKRKEKDDRLYVLTKDKTGSGSSVIRFLPGKTVNGKENLPYSVPPLRAPRSNHPGWSSTDRTSL